MSSILKWASRRGRLDTSPERSFFTRAPFTGHSRTETRQLQDRLVAPELERGCRAISPPYDLHIRNRVPTRHPATVKFAAELSDCPPRSAWRPSDRTPESTRSLPERGWEHHHSLFPCMSTPTVFRTHPRYVRLACSCVPSCPPKDPGSCSADARFKTRGFPSIPPSRCSSVRSFLRRLPRNRRRNRTPAHRDRSVRDPHGEPA